MAQCPFCGAVIEDRYGVGQQKATELHAEFECRDGGVTVCGAPVPPQH